jgi:DNA-3-methyladenine glycosylase I
MTNLEAFPPPAGLVDGEDGLRRCAWHGNLADYQLYHDKEWGRPVVNDQRLFEKICLEGFQSGLSWLTILRKRENFRKAFAGFDFNMIAAFDESDVERLLQDAGIIRHRGKIVSTINNAKRAQKLIRETGSLAACSPSSSIIASRITNFCGLPVTVIRQLGTKRM